MLAGRITVAVMMMVVSAGVAAQGSTLTAYAGFRDGGSFTDVATDEKLDIGSSGTGSVALDIDLDKSRQLQFFVSHQRSDLALEGASLAGGESLDLSVTYLHVGGTNFFNGAIGKGPYVVGGLGATIFDPEGGYDTELRASLNLGLGYQMPLGGTFALRFEARGYATLVNSSGGFFCSGGCVVSIEGDVVTQGELMLGLSARF